MKSGFSKEVTMETGKCKHNYLKEILINKVATELVLC